MNPIDARSSNAESRLVRLLAGILCLAIAWVAGCASPGLPTLAMPKLLKTSPEDVARQRKARAEAVGQHFDESRALAEYQAALAYQQQGDDDACLQTLEGLIQRNPDHRLARLKLAEVLSEQDRPAEAREHVQYLVKKSPEDAEAHHSLAFLLDAAGDEQAALEHYRKADQLSPNHELYQPSYLAARAAAMAPSLGTDAAPEAPLPRELSDATKPVHVLQAPPPGGLGRKSQIDATQASHADSAEKAVASADADPNGSADWASSADLKSDAGFAAAGDLASAISRNPTVTKMLQAGNKALDEGNTAAASSYFRRAMAADPNNPQIPSKAATTALRHNQPDVAVTILREATQAFPGSVPLHQGLSLAYYRRGDFTSSQVAAQQALSLDKSSALSYFLVGSALSRLGQAEVADAHLRQARRLDPRYSAVR